MKVFVVGASGATGQLLVEQLLERGHSVKIVVRSTSYLPADVARHENLSVIRASVLDLGDVELAQQLSGCDALASCLGHNMSFKGMFGPPHRLVTEATRRLCGAVKANRPAKPVRFVLMSTAGNRNRDLAEEISFGQKIVIGLLRLLLPPHADNEEAADYLRKEVKACARKIIRHGFYKTKRGKRRRYRCRICGTTFCSNAGTPYYRLQHRRTTLDEVVALSVAGLNKSAIARVKRQKPKIEDL